MLTRARTAQIEEYVNNVNKKNKTLEFLEQITNIKRLLALFNVQKKHDGGLDTVFDLFRYSVLLVKDYPRLTSPLKVTIVLKIKEILSKDNNYTNLVVGGDFTFNEFLQTCLYRLE